MKHLIFKITSCKITAPYTLELRSNDGSCKSINFEKVLHGEMYSPLRNSDFFDNTLLLINITRKILPGNCLRHKT